MADARATELLAHALELERRDDELARTIAAVSDLAERVAAVRARASAIGASLAELPADLEATTLAHAAAVSEERGAKEALAAAEHRLEELESSRRRKNDELDQARRELTRALDDVADTGARVRRHTARLEELRSTGAALGAEAEGLQVEARAIAAEIDVTSRVPDAGKRSPGDDLEEWGAQARAALFVVRGGLETERQRLVEEANALGSSVLGEALGASSAALVRRRIEQAIG